MAQNPSQHDTPRAISRRAGAGDHRVPPGGAFAWRTRTPVWHAPQSPAGARHCGGSGGNKCRRVAHLPSADAAIVT